MSDHLDVQFSVSAASTSTPSDSSQPMAGNDPWSALKQCDCGFLEELALVEAWIRDGRESAARQGLAVGNDVLKATRLADAMSHVCHASVPPVLSLPPKRAVLPWWSAELEQLRKVCVASRRKYHRCRRRRRRDTDEEEQLQAARRANVSILVAAISEAKKASGVERYKRNAS